mmetsp:Transcript_3038/g.7918  ORF Transcript_3038/g.7918 Transcript_3038/m.7918 type:complete len:327 (+) Transcript_3038:713-1693(+)
MAPAGQCDRGAVVVAHLPEDNADLLRAAFRVRHAHRALRVHVDVPDNRGGERRLEWILLAQAVLWAGAGCDLLLDLARAQREALRAARVVDAPCTEALDGNAHAPERLRARQDKEVSPAQPLAVLLLDRYKERAGLVQVDVVRPTRLYVEALAAAGATSHAICHAEGARAVPGQADEERAVVPEIGGPALLRVRQQLLDVGLHRVEVEALERRGVVHIPGRLLEAVDRGAAERPGAPAGGAPGPGPGLARAACLALRQAHVLRPQRCRPPLPAELAQLEAALLLAALAHVIRGRSVSELIGCQVGGRGGRSCQQQQGHERLGSHLK